MGKPDLYGLILTGGKSSRMGRPKEQLIYYQKPQVERLYELVAPFCTKCFVSCSEVPSKDFRFPYILDKERDIGPMAALLAAFDSFPNKAFLLLACDMPFVSEASLVYLNTHRSTESKLTCFLNPEKDFPEPLFSIWEPRVKENIETAFKQKQYSLRKLIQQTSSKLIKAPDPAVLLNVNTPEEYQKIINQLNANDDPRNE